MLLPEGVPRGRVLLWMGECGLGVMRVGWACGGGPSPTERAG